MKVLGPELSGLEREQYIPNLHAPTGLLKFAQGAASAVSDSQFRDLLMGYGIIGFDIAGPDHAGKPLIHEVRSSPESPDVP